MNRTIRFRGQLLKDGDSFKTHKKGMVIEGGYYEEGDKAYIAKHSNNFEVDKNTVTQMTEFIADGGDTIYEGDIVENSIIKGTITWQNCSFVVYDKNDDWMLLTIAARLKLKIIGNIYDAKKGREKNKIKNR